jgi:hypothetical protein
MAVTSIVPATSVGWHLREREAGTAAEANLPPGRVQSSCLADKGLRT